MKDFLKANYLNFLFDYYVIEWRKLFQQGQSTVQEALWKLLDEILDEPIRIAVRAMAVRQGKEIRNLKKGWINLHCYVMN